MSYTYNCDVSQNYLYEDTCADSILNNNLDHMSDITSFAPNDILFENKDNICGYEYYENYQVINEAFEEDNPSIDSSKIETAINTKFSKCSELVKNTVRNEINELRDKIRVYEEEKSNMMSQFETEKQIEIQEIQYQLQIEKNKIYNLLQNNKEGIISNELALENNTDYINTTSSNDKKGLIFLFKTFPRQRLMRQMSS